MSDNTEKIIPIVNQSVNEIEYTIDYLIKNISFYRISELTNSNAPDLPNIFPCHPLALEYGNMLNADEKGNYTSILPAIGVELTDDPDSGQQFLGSGYKIKEVTSDYLKEIQNIPLKDRFTKGLTLSDDNLSALQKMKDLKGDNKLYGKSQNYLMNPTINISIWSDNFKITRIVYIVLRSLLQKLKHQLSTEGAKNPTLSGQGAIYNYEFNQTLFGAEFTLRFVNAHEDVDVDSSTLTVNSVNESLEGTSINKPIFVDKI